MKQQSYQLTLKGKKNAYRKEVGEKLVLKLLTLYGTV